MKLTNHPSLSQKLILGWSPLLFCLLIISIYLIDPHFYIFTLLFEDGIIEWITVIFSISAAWIVVHLLINSEKYKLETHDKTLLILYALGCIFFAGEEISWGQRIFDVETDEISYAWAELNKQDELNIHNITGFTNVRLIADLFCVVWGIIIPLIYANRDFTIQKLRLYLAPQWLIPGFATCILITWPKKIAEFLFSEENLEWVVELGLGELKESVFGIMIFLFALYLETTIKSRFQNY